MRVLHETTYSSSGNHKFLLFLVSHGQTYQSNAEIRQKLVTFLENVTSILEIKVSKKVIINKSCSVV